MPTSRRTFLKASSAVLASGSLSVQAQFPPQGPPSRYEPKWEVLKRHPLPAWYSNAKLGIFIHWGLYSVPAWAPPTGELGSVDWSKWFYQNPYAEWYLNSLRLKESKTYQHHAKTYGADYDYYRFGEAFQRESRKWQPADWASLFQSVGARYVVLTTKHHDGYTLWPSKVVNPRQKGVNSERDIVGDLSAAVRAKGMRMGLYYSGGLDWTFQDKPVSSLPTLMSNIPQTEEYAAYADAHLRELMQRYQPAILWGDIGYPKAGKIAEIFSEFYNQQPDGLVNNRFGVEWTDFTTPEYSRYDAIVEKKWESCRGLGFSFGYNQAEGPEHVIASDKLIQLVVDIVSKNGNLLLNVGPKPDGTISDIQRDRLRELSKWIAVHGEGIFDTQPWNRASSKDGATEVRFTRKGNAVYAFTMTPQTGTVRIPNVWAAEGTRITQLGSGAALKHKQEARHLVVEASAAGPYPACFKIEPQPWQLVQG